MCYAVYLAIDSETDLAVNNSALVRFERLDKSLAEPVVSLLELPHLWYIGSKSGCSCTFRHLHHSSTALGFNEPVAWFSEEQDAIDATGELYGIIASLLRCGHSVELVDAWEGAQPDDIRNLDVPLDAVTAESFRLFENHRFRFERPQANPEG